MVYGNCNQKRRREKPKVYMKFWWKVIGRFILEDIGRWNDDSSKNPSISNIELITNKNSLYIRRTTQSYCEFTENLVPEIVPSSYIRHHSKKRGRDTFGGEGDARLEYDRVGFYVEI